MRSRVYYAFFARFTRFSRCSTVASRRCRRCRCSRCRRAALNSAHLLGNFVVVIAATVIVVVVFVVFACQLSVCPCNENCLNKLKRKIKRSPCAAASQQLQVFFCTTFALCALLRCFSVLPALRCFLLVVASFARSFLRSLLRSHVRSFVLSVSQSVSFFVCCFFFSVVVFACSFFVRLPCWLSFDSRSPSTPSAAASRTAGEDKVTNAFQEATLAALATRRLNAVIKNNYTQHTHTTHTHSCSHAA